eukprot:Rhum_TRINITY_DN10931_c0_g1::Rhum_TRINITY_DN10931_c0_g1_i1::g.41315::m.41315
MQHVSAHRVFPAHTTPDPHHRYGYGSSKDFSPVSESCDAAAATPASPRYHHHHHHHTHQRDVSPAPIRAADVPPHHHHHPGAVSAPHAVHQREMSPPHPSRTDLDARHTELMSRLQQRHAQLGAEAAAVAAVTATDARHYAQAASVPVSAAAQAAVAPLLPYAVEPGVAAAAAAAATAAAAEAAYDGGVACPLPVRGLATRSLSPEVAVAAPGGVDAFASATEVVPVPPPVRRLTLPDDDVELYAAAAAAVAASPPPAPEFPLNDYLAAQAQNHMLLSMPPVVPEAAPAAFPLPPPSDAAAPSKPRIDVERLSRRAALLVRAPLSGPPAHLRNNPMSPTRRKQAASKARAKSPKPRREAFAPTPLPSTYDAHAAQALEPVCCLAVDLGVGAGSLSIPLLRGTNPGVLAAEVAASHGLAQTAMLELESAIAHALTLH